MKITLRNHTGLQQNLQPKSQAIQIDSFFSYLEIEQQQDVIQEIYVNESLLAIQRNQLIQIPCYMTRDNVTTIQITSNLKPIRITFKFNQAFFTGNKLIDSFADFHRHVKEWASEDTKTINQLISAIQEGDISLLQIINPLTGIDDQSLLNDIYKTLPFALDICAKPRQHLKLEEEILDVELVKRTSPSSLQHLASHSEHWRSRTITGLLPSRLQAEIYEDDFNIYENLFFRMAIEAMLVYVTLKRREIKAAIGQKDVLHDWEHYANEANDYKKMEMLRKLLPEFDLDVEELLKKEFKELEKKLAIVEKQLSSVISTPFYQKLNRNKRLELPIQPTNIINMDNRYNEVFKTWNRLMMLNRKNIKQEDLSGTTITDVNLYYEAYTKIMFIYSLHLIGYKFDESSFIKIKENGYLDCSFTIETPEITLIGKSTTQNDKSIFTLNLIENLEVKCIIPNNFPSDFSEIIDSNTFEERYENERALIFKKIPNKELVNQLKQLIRNHIEENHLLSNAQKRSFIQMDQLWRMQLTDLFNNMPRPREYTLNLYSILGQVGNSENEIMKSTTSLLESIIPNSEISHLIIMPLELIQFEKLLNSRLMKRIVNYGESYDKEDAIPYGNYRSGIFPVTQTDLRSIQRFNKLIFMTIYRKLIEWSIKFETCPSCQSSNIRKDDEHSWRCREFKCQLQWGTTRCTKGCNEPYKWMRPNFEMKIEGLKQETPFEKLQLKEILFDSHVLTDFNIEIKNKNLTYYPICPKCGIGSN